MANTQNWSVDPMHSEVQFKVKHLVISTVTGHFQNFSGTLSSNGDDFNGADVAFEVDVESINTNVKDRDAHLKSADFFDAAQFPKMTFKGKVVNAGGKLTVNGDITIKDVTKAVVFNADLGGIMVDGYGQTKAGFEATGVINRKDFGLTWSMVTEAGGVVVGDEVKLLLNLQFTKA